MVNNGKKKRFQLILEFDGKNFRGWQKQGEKEIRTVQGIILAAAEDIFGQNTIELQGNGRTDAGVHALNYSAHIEVPLSYEAERLKKELNDRLPADVFIKKIVEVAQHFHARHHCLARSYVYLMTEERAPLFRRMSFGVQASLDVGVMHRAAGQFI